MGETNSPTKSKRIFYFDALRAFAIISVILFHVFLALTYIVLPDYGVIPSLNWFVNDICGTFFRCGVNIFLMLSGALSLGRNWDIKPFLAKRLPRITYPFVLWVFVITVVLFLICLYVLNATALMHQYGYKTFASYDLGGFVSFLLNAYVALPKCWFRQYWFYWMILGTYLLMPLLNKCLLCADMKYVEYFLAIWLIPCIFTYTLEITFPVKLIYFSGAVGMVMLGYYLRHTERKIFNNVYAGIVMTVVPAICMVLISYLMSDNTYVYFFNRNCIFLAIESAGIFVLFKTIGQLNININFFKNPEGIFRKSIFSIAKYSYGIYLIHQVILSLLFLVLIGTLHYKALVIVLPVATLLLSWAILALLNRVPHVKNYIGAK